MTEESAKGPWLRLRRRTAEVFYSADKDDPLTHFVDIALIWLISLNVIAVVLESVQSLTAQWGPYFYVFEVFSVAIFTIEYAARVWSVVDNPWHKGSTHPLWGRLKYMTSLMAVIDLAAFAPFYLAFLLPFDLRFLRVMRLLRIFKLTRYSSAMTLLFQVLREEARNIGAAMFVLLLMIVIASSFAYLVEHEAQPEAFSSIPAAMWWAIITMTTVGYGDVIPMTIVGKILGAVIGVMGIGMVALPAGLLASGFSNALHRRRQALADEIEDMLEDGAISDAEQDELAELIQTLDLSDTDARAIMRTFNHRVAHHPKVCPHCGQPIDEAPPEDEDD